MDEESLEDEEHQGTVLLAIKQEIQLNNVTVAVIAAGTVLVQSCGLDRIQ